MSTIFNDVIETLKPHQDYLLEKFKDCEHHNLQVYFILQSFENMLSILDMILNDLSVPDIKKRESIVSTILVMLIPYMKVIDYVASKHPEECTSLINERYEILEKIKNLI